MTVRLALLHSHENLSVPLGFDSDLSRRGCHLYFNGQATPSQVLFIGSNQLGLPDKFHRSVLRVGWSRWNHDLSTHPKHSCGNGDLK